MMGVNNGKLNTVASCWTIIKFKSGKPQYQVFQTQPTSRLQSEAQLQQNSTNFSHLTNEKPT